jgi:hypothetical protein
MNRPTRLLLSLGTLTALLSPSIRAQSLLVYYNFEDGQGDGSLNAEYTDPGANASDWSAHGTYGTGASLSSSLGFVDRDNTIFPPPDLGKAVIAKNWPNLQGGDGTVTESVYEGFNLEPNEGTMTVDTVLFDVAGQSLGNLKVEVVVGGQIRASETIDSRDFDNGLNFSFAPVTGDSDHPIEIRFLGYNGADAQSALYLDNVKVLGVVPELGGQGMLTAIGLLGFGMWLRIRPRNLDARGPEIALGE